MAACILTGDQLLEEAVSRVSRIVSRHRSVAECENEEDGRVYRISLCSFCLWSIACLAVGHLLEEEAWNRRADEAKEANKAVALAIQVSFVKTDRDIYFPFQVQKWGLSRKRCWNSFTQFEASFNVLQNLEISRETRPFLRSRRDIALPLLRLRDASLPQGVAPALLHPIVFRSTRRSKRHLNITKYKTTARMTAIKMKN